MSLTPQDSTSQQIPTETLPSEWHVASIIVHTQPIALNTTRNWLEGLPGAEIHASSDQGKLVVVLESLTAQSILDVIDQASAHPGVLNAALVYHEVLPPEEDTP